MENEVTEVTQVDPPKVLREEIAAGTMLGDIQLVEPVGGGLSSEVFRGENRLAGKPCAIKVVRSELELGSVERGRYIHEAKQVCGLGHPGIADVFSFGHTSGGRSFTVSEWVSGHSLRDLVRQHAPLSRRSLLPLIREICGVLGAVHHAGLAHRRLHAGNIMVDWQQDAPPRLKLLDFGVWHLHPKLDDTTSEVARSAEHAICIAPEIARGESGDSRSDVYALGVLLYEMLTGKVPFLGESFAATLAQLQADKAAAPSEVGAPSGLDEMVLHALEKDPKYRTPSVEAFLSALDPAWATSTGQHAPVSKGKVRALTTGELRLEDLQGRQRSPSGDAPLTVPSSDEPPPLLQHRRRRVGLFNGRRGLYIGMGVAVLLFCATMGYLLLGGDEEQVVVKRPPPRKSVKRIKRKPRPPRSAAKPPSKTTTARTKSVPRIIKRLPGQPLRAIRTPGRPGVGKIRPIDKPKLYGTLTLVGKSPKTQFFLDGKFVGQGDRRILRRVPVGAHRLHVVVDGRNSPAKRVSLKANQKLTINF